MQIEKYKGVIRMVLAKNAGQSPEYIANELVKSIEIAQSITGELEEPEPAPRKANVSKETPRQELRSAAHVPPPPPATGGAVLISSAPPVAGADDTDDDDIDYYESRPGKGDGCRRLEAKLQQMLPQSITVRIPGIADPLNLVRGVGSPGLKFVHVSYTLPGDQMGPRYTVMTSQKDIDPDAIIRDIISQAGTMYSKEKRVIQPHAMPAAPPPTNQELQAMLDRDRRAQQPNDGVSGEDAVAAAQAAAEWGSNRSPRWQ